MAFRSVFIALVIGTALLVAAFMINWYRPRGVTDQPSPALVRASGKCAECHANMQFSVVHEYEMSAHARSNVNCLQCHQPANGQQGKDHHGFTISAGLTAANCRACHEAEYRQYVRSRHASPSWAAVYGEKGVREAGLGDPEIEQVERYHPRSVRRRPTRW
jgi:hydroxylamine dehydrogenase